MDISQQHTEYSKNLLVRKLSEACIESTTLGCLLRHDILEEIAESLLDQNVVVPPIKVGDSVYFIQGKSYFQATVKSYENGSFMRAWCEALDTNVAIPNFDVGVVAFEYPHEAAEKLRQILTMKEDSDMFYWHTFADGYRCCVKGFSKNELAQEERKHGKLTSKIPA